MMERLKNFEREVKILLTFFLGYGIFYLIPQLFDFPMTINYWLSELNREVSFVTNVNVIVETFLTGPLFALLIIKVFDDIFPKESIPGREPLPTKRVNHLKSILIVAIGVMILGNAVHKVVNDLNASAFAFSHDFSNPLYANLYFGIYWWDEFFGHLALAVPFYIVIIIYAIGVLRMTPAAKFSPWTWIFYTAIGVGYGIEWFIGWAEGQALLVIGLLNGGILVFLGAYLKKRRTKIKDHPFLWVIIVQAIVFLICLVFWGILTGIKSEYPFFYQPGEEIW